MTDAIRIEGTRELIRKLREYPDKTGSVLRSATRDGMKPVQESAARRVPRGTKGHWYTSKGIAVQYLPPGYAKAHILRATFLSRDKQSATTIVGPHKYAWYASKFVEFGIPSRQYSAQPWLVPAFEANQQAAIDQVGKTIGKRIRAIARKHAGQKLK